MFLPLSGKRAGAEEKGGKQEGVNNPFKELSTRKPTGSNINDFSPHWEEPYKCLRDYSH